MKAILLSILALKFSVIAIAETTIDLKSFAGVWKSDSCLEEGKPSEASYHFNVRLVQGEQALEFSYVAPTALAGDTTKNFSTVSERFIKINGKMQDTEMVTTTESKIIGNEIIVGAIHQSETNNPEEMKVLSANITRIKIENDKMIYRRDGFTVQTNEAGSVSLECKLSKL